MSGPVWDPAPLAAILIGLAGIAAWLVLVPPSATPRGILRVLAALLLTLILFDAGCATSGAAGGPRLVVLEDRSLSMEAAGRAGPARAWIDRLESLEGWRVERDSFGGATTDLATAIARVEARLPGAIVVVSDGRAAGGRAAEPAGVPLYAHAPGPLVIEDLAVGDVIVEEAERGAVATVEIAAVGGLATPARAVEVLVAGRRAGGVAAGGALAPGERRIARVELPRLAAGAVVEARLVGDDAVPGNDRRARVTGAGAGPRTVLLVGLRPSWELGFVRRELERAEPVEVVWAAAPGQLVALDSRGAPSWRSLDAGRYRTVWLFGDPALLGDAGRGWVEGFVARGGRGLAWFPAGHAGAVPGSGAVSGSAGASGRPELTEAGTRWLVALGTPLDAPPDGTWPPIELLPAAADPPAGASVLVTAGGRPAAWTVERGASRMAVHLGTGWYRWRLAPEEARQALWRNWIGALARWLAGAEAADRPLVRMPAGARLARADTLVAPLVAQGDYTWSVARSEGGEVVERGELEEQDRALRAGPFAPGAYRLVVASEDGARRGAYPFVVETWAPDLAWTAADTASLAAAARASGGGLLGEEPRFAPPPDDSGEGARGRAFGLGTMPWAYLLVALLLLTDWGLGRRALARPMGAS